MQHACLLASSGFGIRGFGSELDADVQTRLHEVTSQLEQAQEEQAAQARQDQALVASLQEDIKISKASAAEQVAFEMLPGCMAKAADDELPAVCFNVIKHSCCWWLGQASHSSTVSCFYGMMSQDSIFLWPQASAMTAQWHLFLFAFR